MQTVIHIKADKEVKENAQKAAKDLGLSLSDVINAALRNFIRSREVVFSDAPQMSQALEKKIKEFEEDLKYGREVSPKFKTAKEFNKYLDSL